jgi:hypothetical protein
MRLNKLTTYSGKRRANARGALTRRRAFVI